MPQPVRSSPWLNVPLADYEGHMTSSSVLQLGALSELFAESLAAAKPASVAVIGIAGGNGLEHIDDHVTRRVVGIDINAGYLEAVRSRFPKLAGLELHCLDLANEAISLAPVELVHAALVFEHAGTGLCLDNALQLTAPGGTISIVLQLPSETAPGVGQGQFESIQNLSSHFAMIDPASLVRTLERRGFRVRRETRRSLVAGKAFWMGVFTRHC